MRYNLESTLPIRAFSPRGGRSPFTHGMTLEGGGGGGGGFIGDVVGSIGDLFGSVGDAVSGAVEGVGDVFEGIGQGIGDIGVAIDEAVGDVVPGGWGTVAAIAVPYAAPYAFGAMTAAQAAMLAAGTSAATSAVKGRSLEDTLKSAALSGALSYGLGSLGDGATPEGIEGGMNNEFGAGTSGYGEANEALSSNVVQTPSGNYVTDYSAPAPDVAPDVAPDISAPDISAPDISAPDVFNDGFSPSISPDYIQVPGDPGFNMQPGAEPYLGVLPTSNIPTDMTVGTQFEGPNGPEIVAPNGKTYLMKDLESAYLNQPVVTPTAPDIAPTETLTNIADTTPKSVVKSADAFNPDPNTSVVTNDAGRQVNIYDRSALASPETQKMADMGMMDRLAQMPGYAYDVAAQYVKTNPLTTAALGLGAYNMLSAQGQQQQQQQQQQQRQSTDSTYKPPYYGTAGPMVDPYLLRNRVNASNVYDRTASTRRYAEGGEVKHFGIGGIANTLTRVFQPLEKTFLQPIGKIPGVKEALPYAGLIAAPFIANPMMAAGVGGLTSGFGTPGSGFNMKRAIMGGIASYGLSNIGAGVEEAGATPLSDGAPTLNTDVESQYGGFYGNEGKTDQLSGKGNSFFRSPEAMSKGVSNFMGNGTYDKAAAAFGSKAGMGSAGAALMGTTGMMGIDEAEKQLKAEKDAGAISDSTYQEQKNRIAAAKASAEKAVREHPYQFAMGGQINSPDDQTEMPNQTPMQRLENRGVMDDAPAMNYALGGNIPAPMGMNVQQNDMRYAMGGNVNAPRFLSGGGDGMSDSIKATIDGKREARLADGEFVVPADVVSGLGNGSSKAGAKQLYAMMDRVRQSRTGTVKQGKQINPKKVLKV